MQIKQTILITGASGFIGSFMVEEALRQGFDVWAGIRKTSSREYLQDDRIRLFEMDFSEKDKLRQQLATMKAERGQWDYVVHCAGVTKCRDKADFDRYNFTATRNFVEALLALDMLPRKFIYFSSLSVYGPVHEQDYASICDADTPCPNTAYGRSKVKTENYLRSLPSFPCIILRPTGVYGPRERDYFLMAKSIRNHVDFAAGLKRQVLTFVYVKDLVQAAFLAIHHGNAGKSYFVSDGREYSSRTFSDYIRKELGYPWVIRVKCPLIILKALSLSVEFVASLIGKNSTLNSDKFQIMKQRNWQCDITPLVEELGYRPEYSLERGVKETIAWYKKERWL